MLNVWTQIVVILFSAPPEPCAKIESRFLERIEQTSEIIEMVSVHPNGGVASENWQRERRVRAWSDAFDQGRELKIPGTLVDVLADGRFVVHFNKYGDPGEHYEVWSWDGSLGVSRRGRAESSSELAALICRISTLPTTRPSPLKRESFCVGDRLLAHDPTGQLLVWEKTGWKEVGVQLSRHAYDDARFGLQPDELARAESPFARLGIPTYEEPELTPTNSDGLLVEVTCGQQACWARNRAGDLLVYDLRFPDPRWVRIGQVRNPNAPSLLSGDERAILAPSDCPGALYYLKLPRRPSDEPEHNGVLKRIHGRSGE